MQHSVGIFFGRKCAKLCETQFITQTAIYDNSYSLVRNYTKLSETLQVGYILHNTLQYSTCLCTKKPYDIVQSQLINTHEKESQKIIMHPDK
jgi:hypothetical protein